MIDTLDYIDDSLVKYYPLSENESLYFSPYRVKNCRTENLSKHCVFRCFEITNSQSNATRFLKQIQLISGWNLYQQVNKTMVYWFISLRLRSEQIKNSIQNIYWTSLIFPNINYLGSKFVDPRKRKNNFRIIRSSAESS